ncbi:dTDP-4-dehydrorhamnose 3,5-epimerase [Aeromonas salmonicida]|uniref:dTDP-4-dehydrorhamnose 3,5-epimerase n=1 Tax=Aeromonas salmonicida TaxID=645 RepID=UPI00370DD15F
MNVIITSIPDVMIFEPTMFIDERGFLFESFNYKTFKEGIGRPVSFVQDNHSKSSRGVLRGLHYQISPHEQGKLVRCVVGEIFDVAVDVRKDSPDFGKWVGVYLSAENKRQLWIPEGFAHGFYVLSECAEVLYKSTSYYFPAHERTIKWSDPDLNIAWPMEKEPLLSDKDARALSFSDVKRDFL